MLVFFFILPRTRHPLWNFLNPGSQQSQVWQKVCNLELTCSSRQTRPCLSCGSRRDGPGQPLLAGHGAQPGPKADWIRVPPPREKVRPVIGSSRDCHTENLCRMRVTTITCSLWLSDHPGSLGLEIRVMTICIYGESALDRPYRLEILVISAQNLVSQGQWINRFIWLAEPISDVDEAIRYGITDKEATVNRAD